MADVAKLKRRLEAMTTVDAVLPTTRSDGERASRLAEIAIHIERGDVERADIQSADDIGRVLARENYSGSAVAELATSESAREQIACFSRAGYGFFRSTPAFVNRSLSDRRAAGGNGAIRRIRRSGEHLLLETARLVVRFVPDTSNRQKREALNRHNLIPLRPLRFANAQYCATDQQDVVDFCLHLMTDPVVEYAEPDFVEAIPQRRQPKDPEYMHQWHHPAINNPLAWEVTTGSPTRIAVVDNGFDRQHPDLKLDNAFSGWFRPTPDNEDALFIPGIRSLPDSNHGTACAGMVAAAGNSGVGGTGVAYDASLAAVACMADQVGTQLTLARALAYAADPAMEVTSNFAPGADVISCSLGPNGASWEMRSILSDAIDFVTSSGRDGRGTPLFWAVTNGNFPVCADEVCAHPETIAVGRSSADDTDDGSGYGPELDFLAPGVDVWLPASGGHYHRTTGTSFAAPCAAGVAALALARCSTLTAREVRELMRRHADPVGNVPYDECGRNDYFGHGRINAWEVVRAV